MTNKLKSNWLPILLSLVIVALLTMQGARASYTPSVKFVTSGAGLAVLPAAAVGVTVTANATDNTYGSYVELRSASGNAIYIVGISVYRSNTGNVGGYVQLRIGTGTAASETAVGEIPFNSITTNVATYYPVPLTNSLPVWIPVAASTRIAVQAMEADTAAAGTYVVKLWTIDQANVVAQ